MGANGVCYLSRLSHFRPHSGGGGGGAGQEPGVGGKATQYTKKEENVFTAKMRPFLH